MTELGPTEAAGSFLFADLFAGIGGFHAALAHAGGQAAFVSEIDEQAMRTYAANWIESLPDEQRPTLNADINTATPDVGDLQGVPDVDIDVLTAGFPCQPFSKSGAQRGMDEVRGTLFFNIARFLEQRTPSVILLENVRNLVGPRHEHEWDVIVDQLRRIGYRVSSTPSVFSPHFLPPSLGGTPQVRDRVFILGTYVGPRRSQVEVPPTLVRSPVAGWNPQWWDTQWILDDETDQGAYALNDSEQEWIDVWDEFVRLYREARGERLPGHPLWEQHWMSHADKDKWIRKETRRTGLPVPGWKVDFLNKNAQFYEDNVFLIDKVWRKRNPQINSFPASRRKLEWQAQDESSLHDTVMHFRPSGIRAKRPTYLPALVAITQTSILGRNVAQRHDPDAAARRITPGEAARLQGLPPNFKFANTSDAASYRQVGNGVCVGAAWYALRKHVEQDRDRPVPEQRIPPHVAEAILDAPRNPSPGALSPAAFEVEAKHLGLTVGDLQRRDEPALERVGA